MINQLFIRQPDINYIIQCINILGYENLNDTRELSKVDILSKNICVEFQKLDIIFRTFYLPCKQSKFLINYDFKTCITICRQLLRTINYDIISKEKIIHNTKMMVYSIVTKTQKEEYKLEKKRRKEGKVTKLDAPIIIDFN